MDTATKAGARHSSADRTHINHTKAHAKAIMEHMAALGAAEDLPEEPSADGMAETKALPPGTDPIAYAVQECNDMQGACGALQSLTYTLQSEIMQDDEAGQAALTEAIRQIITFISAELSDATTADDEEDAGDGTIKSSDTIVYAGDAVKSLADGHVGGYLVRFSTKNDPDLAGEYFTKNTDFGITDGAKTHVWFHHRGAFKSEDGRTVRVSDPIGEGTLKMDDTGVFVDAVLYNRARYKDILSELGWSSGTASHLVDMEPQGKATWIKRWPLGLDATLTFGPCEPRNAAVPLKSLAMAEMPFNPDTKSKAEQETTPETGHDQPVVPSKALSALVTLYTSFIEDDIKARLNRVGRHTHNG